MAESITNGMQPLPLQNVQAGVVPLGSSVTKAPAVEETSPVEEWLAEDNKFDAPVAETPTEPAAETPATEPTATPQETQTDVKPAAATQEPTQPQATTEPKPAEPAAQAKTYAPDEKFALAEGTEWTREQIVNGLQERTRLQPIAAEGEGFQKLFGMSLKDAQENWGPILQRLSTEQNVVNFIDGYLGNKEKAEYLELCAAHFDQQKGSVAPTAATTPAGNDVTRQLQQQVTELNAWRTKQLQDAANARASRELQTVTEKYPFLATDEQARKALFKLAMALHNEDVNNGVPDLEARGILDAVQMNAALYDARLIAERQQATTTVAPATQTVPAVLGSQGASPGGSRQTTPKPEANVDLNEAVEQWLATESRNYQ